MDQEEEDDVEYTLEAGTSASEWGTEQFSVLAFAAWAQELAVLLARWLCFAHHNCALRCYPSYAQPSQTHNRSHTLHSLQ